MKRKVLAAILAAVLICTSAVPAYAASYSDLNGHWAKEYMEDLAGRKYLSGYEDGTMRPDNSMTACETLVLLSRFYELTDEQAELIGADYEPVAAAAVPSSLTWAHSNLAICLAAGIISETELKSCDLTQAVQKQDLAVFLVRAMQLTDQASLLSSAPLTYADAAQVTSACRGSVAELVALGILKGDNQNYLYPKSAVTRAVVATMVSRALDYLEEKGTKLTIAAYEGVSRGEGILTAVNGSTIAVRGFDGPVREYTVPTGASVTVNGSAKTLSSLYVGCYADLTFKDGQITQLALESDSTVAWSWGTVSSSGSYSTTEYYLYLKKPDSDTLAKYEISSAAADVYLNGAKVTPASLAVGQIIALRVVSGVVKQVRAADGGYAVTGEIASLKFGSEVTLRLTDAGGTLYLFTLDIAKLPEIRRGDTVISVDRLMIGSTVTLTAKNGEVASIVTVGSENTITGELTSTATTKSGTQWVITQDSGTVVTLTLDANAVAYSGTTSILLSAIGVGARVSVVVYDNTITEVSLKSAESSVTKLTGTVLAVDTQGRIITLLTPSDRLMYVDARYYTAMIVAETGYTTYLTALVKDNQLLVYGSYTDSTHFKAITVIVES